MENASKALIIAGAILLSILIIGLGMMIFTQARNAITDTGLNDSKVTAYNSQFEDYMGENVNGTKVRSLCDLVRNHNITTQEDETLQITIADKTTASDINSYKATIKAGKTYKVKVAEDGGYDTKTGYIVKITVEENK